MFIGQDIAHTGAVITIVAIGWAVWKIAVSLFGENERLPTVEEHLAKYEAQRAQAKAEAQRERERELKWKEERAAKEAESAWVKAYVLGKQRQKILAMLVREC